MPRGSADCVDPIDDCFSARIWRLWPRRRTRHAGPQFGDERVLGDASPLSTSIRSCLQQWIWIVVGIKLHRKVAQAIRNSDDVMHKQRQLSGSREILEHQASSGSSVRGCCAFRSRRSTPGGRSCRTQESNVLIRRNTLRTSFDGETIAVRNVSTQVYSCFVFWPAGTLLLAGSCQLNLGRKTR